MSDQKEPFKGAVYAWREYIEPFDSLKKAYESGWNAAIEQAMWSVAEACDELLGRKIVVDQDAIEAILFKISGRRAADE